MATEADISGEGEGQMRRWRFKTKMITYFINNCISSYTHFKEGHSHHPGPFTNLASVHFLLNPLKCQLPCVSHLLSWWWNNGFGKVSYTNSDVLILPLHFTVWIQLCLKHQGLQDVLAGDTLDRVLFDGTDFYSPGEMICNQEVQSDLGN